MKRLITRPRSLLLAVALTVVAALCTVSTANAASSASETVVPAAPSNLTAKAVSPTSVHLTWTNNATSQSGVVISRNGVESVDVQGATVSSYTWNGLSPGTKYWFYVASKIYGTPGDPTGSGNTQSAWVGPVYATTLNVRSTSSPDPNGNWAGYLAQTGSVPTEVNGSFVQPKITCAKGESSSAGFWVGVSDSTGGTTIAQDGTSAFCYNGHPGYYLWWEAFHRSAAQGGGEPVPVLNTNAQGVNVAPAACKRSPKFTGSADPSLKQLAFLVDNNCVTPIKPGDTIELNVDVAPHSYAVFFAYVPKTHFELNTSQTFSNVVTGGSEWVAESQHLGSGLSDFGKVTFTDCYVYTGTANTPGEPISNFNDLKLDLIYDVVLVLKHAISWKTAASPSTLTPVTGFNNGTQDGFTVNWYNHGLPIIAKSIG